MTHATKAIYRWLLSDYVKVRLEDTGQHPSEMILHPNKSTLLYCSNISADEMLYAETDLEESMDKIETINFHEVREVAGIKFWCYHAGHVLGAAMFMIEIAGVKVKSLDFYFYCFVNYPLMQFLICSCCTQETSHGRKTDT